MKKTTLILLLALFMICLLGCNLSVNGGGESNQHFFVKYQDGSYYSPDIVYDRDTKVVYYYEPSSSSHAATLVPYYLPDGSIAVYGKNFPYKGE